MIKNNYDVIITAKSLEFKQFLAEKINSNQLATNLIYSESLRIASEYLAKRTLMESDAWNTITQQLEGKASSRTGNTSILVPVYDEHIDNLIALANSLKNYTGEIIFLFNSGKNESRDSNARNWSVFNLFLDFVSRHFQCVPLKITPIQAIGILDSPSVGTARDLLLKIEAYLFAKEPTTINKSNRMHRKLLMTDADCTVSTQFMQWFDATFDNSDNVIALTPNIRFRACNNPSVSEGIRNNDHLIILMIGELYRNIMAFTGMSYSDREERCWIGMGIGFSLEAGMLADGFPYGWTRKEDHYLGAMLEAIEDSNLGEIVHATASSPSIDSFIRGSKRTAAGMGYTDENALSGLVRLEKLALSHSPEEIKTLSLAIDNNSMEKIINMPTTKLLVDLIKADLAQPNPETLNITNILNTLDPYLQTYSSQKIRDYALSD